jgi:hypothetical protein
MILSGTIYFLWYRFGFFSEYNFFTAKKDIDKGKVQFVYYGLAEPTTKQREIDSLNLSFGFSIEEKGCVCTKQELNAANAYNDVIENYLVKRNGENWRIIYEYSVDSINKYNTIFNN